MKCAFVVVADVGEMGSGAARAHVSSLIEMAEAGAVLVSAPVRLGDEAGRSAAGAAAAVAVNLPGEGRVGFAERLALSRAALAVLGPAGAGLEGSSHVSLSPSPDQLAAGTSDFEEAPISSNLELLLSAIAEGVALVAEQVDAGSAGAKDADALRGYFSLMLAVAEVAADDRIDWASLSDRVAAALEAEPGDPPRPASKATPPTVAIVTVDGGVAEVAQGDALILDFDRSSLRDAETIAIEIEELQRMRRDALEAHADAWIIERLDEMLTELQSEEPLS